MNEIKNKFIKNKFELEGNVANINDVYINQNGKKILRFDLAQNSVNDTQFIPVVLKSELATSYGSQIQKGDWISIKGKICTYSKDIEKDGKIYKDKNIDILAFEIEDKKKHIRYLSNGQTEQLSNDKNDSFER